MKYKKLPVIVEAVQFNGENFEEIITFTGDRKNPYNPRTRQMFIRTREGEMTANEGDYIIKGIAGEFSICRSDLFPLSYELVEAAHA